MDKDKSRGIKHIKDKRKYKGNTNKNDKYVPQKSKPNLGSNWDRYDKEDEEDQDFLGTDDFAILADAPIAKGKHFQSKSDKLLANETESASLSELFTLNLEKLEESLMTIPFYERVSIDSKYFVDNQIEFMKRDADENLKKYNESITLKLQENISNDSSGETEEEQEIVPNVEEKIEENKENKSSDKNEELEQWLDDFLNE